MVKEETFWAQSKQARLTEGAVAGLMEILWGTGSLHKNLQREIGH